MSTERGQGELVEVLRSALDCGWRDGWWVTKPNANVLEELSEHLAIHAQDHVDAEVAAALEGAADDCEKTADLMGVTSVPIGDIADWLRVRAAKARTKEPGRKEPTGRREGARDERAGRGAGGSGREGGAGPV